MALPDDFPYEIMIREKDLPSRFHFKSSDFPENDVGISYYVIVLGCYHFPSNILLWSKHVLFKH